jgi:hypothetical protein
VRETKVHDRLQTAARQVAYELGDAVATLGSFIDGSVMDMSRHHLYQLLAELGDLGRRMDRLTVKVCRAAQRNRE